MSRQAETAVENYRSGCNCAQAVLCACVQESGLDPAQAYRLMEGFGGGCGGMQEVCGALAGAFAAISFKNSDGKQQGGTTKAATAQMIRRAAALYRAEFGGITCRDILHNQPPRPQKCADKVRRAAEVAQEVFRENETAEHRG